jgi:hypothetical protein
LGFFGGALTWARNSLARPRQPSSTSAHFRVLVEPLSDALGAHGGLVAHATGPHDPAEQSAALGVAEGSGLVLTVFCLFLPEMNALRPGRPTRGRRTCISVPSIRSLTACAPVWSPTHCG